MSIGPFRHIYRSVGTGLFAAGVAALMSGAAFADTIVVSPGVPGAINAAIAAANDGDVIQLTAGTYLEGEVIDTQGKELTIAGVDPELGSGVTIIDGADAHRLFQFVSQESYSTVLRDLRIVNGRHPQGAGLYCAAGAGPRVQNCLFSGHNKGESGWYTIYSAWDFPFCNASPYLSLQNVFLCDNGDDVFSYKYGCLSETFNVCERVVCADCDADGAIDECAIEFGLVADCDGNLIPDACDIANGTYPDCDQNLVPDQCDADCDGDGIPDDCETSGEFDCNANGLPDRDEGPTFCPDSSMIPVDLIVIADPSGSDIDKLGGLCSQVFEVVVADLESEFDLRAAWVTVRNGQSLACTDWSMPIGTAVPTCAGVQIRFIDDGDGEEWGDASAVMTTPYDNYPIGANGETWPERDAVLILIPISDEGPQNGDDQGGCRCDDLDSVSNLISQALIENVQVVPMPTPETSNCVFDPTDPASLMNLTAAETGGSVVDARLWPTGTSSSELAEDLEAAIRAAVAVSPRVECPDCPADLNGDGCVDGGDLGLFLTYWGSSDEFSPGNLDGQAPVNGADLGVLLTGWGVCPGVERCGG